jgi:hypothetical protein
LHEARAVYRPGLRPLSAVGLGFRLGLKRVQPLELLREALQRLEDVLAVGLLFDGQSHRGDLPGEILGLGQRAGIDLAVALDLGLVTVGLAVLGEQDQRRGVGGLGGEAQVEQDERIGIPVTNDPDDIEGDPDEHRQRLADQVAPGAQKARQ